MSHHLVGTTLAFSTLGALFERSAHLFALQLLQILNQAVCKQSLATHLASGALPALHFPNELPPFSPDLLLLYFLPSLLHALNLTLVAIFLILLFLPLFICNFSDDLFVLIVSQGLHFFMLFVFPFSMLDSQFILLLV
jgi:hypothetical protein